MAIFRFLLKKPSSLFSHCPFFALLLKTFSLLILILSIHRLLFADQMGNPQQRSAIRLPKPKVSGRMSVEEAINSRESVRRYAGGALSMEEVSQLLWACIGFRVDSVTQVSRTSPSAGGLYPLEVFLVASKVDSIEMGIYSYSAEDHTLHLVKKGDYRTRLARAAGGQLFIEDAPASIVIAAMYQKTEVVYGSRGRFRYVPMDVGHAAQNVYLQAAALGLGTVAVGAFIDRDVKDLLGLKQEEPLSIMPVGRTR